MKWTTSAVLLAACAGAGCVSLPGLKEPSIPTAGIARPAPEVPATNPDQITDANAREAAGRLAQELDQASTTAAPAMPKNGNIK